MDWGRTPYRRIRPFKVKRNNGSKSTKKDESHNGPEGLAPVVGIPDVGISIGTFTHPCGTPVTLPPQLPERFARFIVPAKVSNEKTFVHPDSVKKWEKGGAED
jgi:hypothetical protein